MGRVGSYLKKFTHWSGRAEFVPKARYFKPKWVGFLGQNQVGPKTKLKSHFLLTQSKKKSGRARPRAKNSAQNPAQKWFGLILRAGLKWSALSSYSRVWFFQAREFSSWVKLDFEFQSWSRDYPNSTSTCIIYTPKRNDLFV